MKQSVHGAKDHRVIIFENDSTDKTFSIMRVMAAPPLACTPCLVLGIRSDTAWPVQAMCIASC